MKLQIAIDRVLLEEAVYLSNSLNGISNIIEIGTSLIKDYGNLAIKNISEVVSGSRLLVDLKTIDEGAYEFKQGYKYGGDILTVMGAASIDTINECYQVSQIENKEMMIDLLEVSDSKIKQLIQFEQAIFCLHHSIDRKDFWDIKKSVFEFNKSYPKIKRLAIAGGIELDQIKEIRTQGLIEIVIVGSSITKSNNPVEQAKLFMEAIDYGSH